MTLSPVPPGVVAVPEAKMTRPPALGEARRLLISKLASVTLQRVAKQARSFVKGVSLDKVVGVTEEEIK